MSLKLVTSSVAILLTVGCASTPTNYQRANTSQETFQRDLWECQQLVNQSYQAPQQGNSPSAGGAAVGYLIGRAATEKGRHRDCMFGRGYQPSSQ